MIRPAVPDDLVPLVLLAWGAFKGRPWEWLAPLDLTSLAESLAAFIDNPDECAVLVDEDDAGDEGGGGAIVGAAVAVFEPLWTNRHHLAGRELFFCSTRPNGGEALRRALEAERERRNAGSLTLGAVAGLRDKALARVYRREGYELTDLCFTRVF